MPISKAYRHLLFLQIKKKCVDHNWSKYLLIASNGEYFRTHTSFQRNERNDDAIYQGILGPDIESHDLFNNVKLRHGQPRLII